MYYNEFHLVAGQDKIAQCNLNKMMFAWWMADSFNTGFSLMHFICALTRLPPSPILGGGRQAQQSNLASEQNRNQGGLSNGHVSQRPATLPGSLWTVVGIGQPPVNFWKARQVFTTWLLLRSSSVAQGTRLIPERQQAPSTDGLQRVGSALRPPVLTVSSPQGRTAVGMPLLSMAFISVVGRCCFGGLQRWVSGVALLMVTTLPPSHDEHVPSAEQKGTWPENRTRPRMCTGIVSEACVQTHSACSKRILNSSSRKYKGCLFIYLLSQL